MGSTETLQPFSAVGIAVRSAGHDHIYIRLCLPDADAGFETSYHIHPLVILLQWLRFEDERHCHWCAPIPQTRYREPVQHPRQEHVPLLL